jgi:hypothetical protein
MLINSLDLMLGRDSRSGIAFDDGRQPDEQFSDPLKLVFAEEVESGVSIDHFNYLGQMEGHYVDQVKPNGPTKSKNNEE